jgi:hypothetical protein
LLLLQQTAVAQRSNLDDNYCLLDLAVLRSLTIISSYHLFDIDLYNGMLTTTN